jgi:arginine repressor
VEFENQMVDKKEPKGMNKSEEIRKLATAMKERDEKPRPVVIVATLKKQGIAVSSPQVSMVLKRMGFRPRKRRKSGEVAVVSKKVSKPVASRGAQMISVEELIVAKRVVNQLGGTDRALAAIAALKRFES